MGLSLGDDDSPYLGVQECLGLIPDTASDKPPL